MNINATAEYNTKEACDFIASHLKAMFNETHQNVDNVTVTIKDSAPQYVAPVLDWNAPVPQSVLKWIVDGNLIGAIKEYRAISGLGLKEAKDYVEHVQAIIRGRS